MQQCRTKMMLQPHRIAMNILVFNLYFQEEMGNSAQQQYTESVMYMENSLTSITPTQYCILGYMRLCYQLCK